jgi:hypothetical protein
MVDQLVAGGDNGRTAQTFSETVKTGFLESSLNI